MQQQPIACMRQQVHHGMQVQKKYSSNDAVMMQHAAMMQQ
jgi:hypothetical protein